MNYLNVLTAQTTLLAGQRSAIDVLTRRMTASVSLIQAIGGGWDATSLPSSDEIAERGRTRIQVAFSRLDTDGL